MRDRLKTLTPRPPLPPGRRGRIRPFVQVSSPTLWERGEGLFNNRLLKGSLRFRALDALVGLALLLAACGGDNPAKTVTQGAELLSVTFDDTTRWETGEFRNDDGDLEAALAITEGRYQIDYTAGRGASFTWGAGGDAYQNVIIEVTAEQISAENDNLYGVICRLRLNEDGQPDAGYALLVSGDGHYGIAEIRSGGLSFALDWHQSGQIAQGQSANTIRAACVDDYLALSVNDSFLGDITDDSYPDAGQVALIAGVTGDASVRVTFDDLMIYAGEIGE